MPPWSLPPYPGAMPPRRSNTGAIVATILICALLVGAGVVGVATATNRKPPVADVGYDYPEAQPRDAGSGPTSRAPRRTTRRPAPTTTTTRPVLTTTRATPTPTTPAGPRPVLALGDNPLFAGDRGAGPVTCGLSRWSTDPQAAAAFFNSALICLEATWAPLLQASGLPYRRPNLETPPDSTVNSPCGDAGRFAAFYCPRNETIYMPFGTLQTEKYGARPGVYLGLFAHEFGHHVQQVSGVWDAYWNARYEAGADTEPGLELSRRAELQAQCFSGMFLAGAYPRGSVDRNILQEARTTQDRGDHAPGEPRDHGTDAHAVAWWEHGAQKNRTYECNTWLAPSAQVA